VFIQFYDLSTSLKIETKYEELEEEEKEKEDVKQMILSHCNFHLTTSNHIKFNFFL